MSLFNRNPFRKRPLLDLLLRFDNFMDPKGDGRYIALIAAIFLVIMMVLFGDCMKEDGQYNRHVRYNEHTGQYYRYYTY